MKFEPQSLARKLLYLALGAWPVLVAGSAPDRASKSPAVNGRWVFTVEHGEVFYKDNPNYKVALDQLRTAQRFPFSPALFDIQREVIQPNLEAAVLGTKTSAEIVSAADQKANEIISKYDK